MDVKQLVESIVREVVNSIDTEAMKPPKVLYVFGDSTSHEAYTDHFITLNNGGLAHDLLLLDGQTSGWLGKHRVESGGPDKVIAVDEFAPAPLEIPLDYEGVVVPEIDLDNAGRAALGLKGTVLSEVIFSTLVQGKFVLIGEDVSGLKRVDKRTLKMISLPKPYQNLFDYYKHELTLYGAQFAPRTQLAELAVAKCGSPAAGGEAGSKGNTTTSGGGSAFEGRLVSADWVRQQLKDKSFTRLTVGPGTILSPLAKDMLKEKAISVDYADER